MIKLPNSLRRTSMLLALISAIFSVGAQAQLTTATIVGTITDSTGAVIPGASVTATNVDTHFARTVPSAPDGTYRLEFLPIGRYELKIASSGFKAYSQTNITLNLNDQLHNDVTLSLGNATETVTVTDAPSLVQSAAASLGRAIDDTEGDNLPLVDRNVYALIALPSVVQHTTQRNVL